MRWISPLFVILAAAIVAFAVTSVAATGSLARGSVVQSGIATDPAPPSVVGDMGQ